jgi:4-amino-4-deoxy-L-arabinose transferase-like glycosyltransferase
VAYHNFTSPEFNVNVALLGFWALTVLLFWRATRRDSLRAWALTGAAAAAAILSKYLAVFLLLPLFLYLLVDDQARAQLRRPGPYLGLACFLALLAPHLAWVWQHDFVTLGYGLQRTGVGEHPGWSAHLLNPLRFLLAQAAHLVLPLLLLWLLARPAWQAGSDASRRYLLFAGLGPLLGFLVISALTGMRLRSMWGTPLLAIAGLYLVYHLLPPAATWRWRRFALGWGLAAALFPLAYALAYQADPSKRTHYPGRELARQFEAYWEARFQRPLSIVIGDEWFAGNVGWYAVARPSVYLEVDPAIATWVDDVRVRAHGALLVWDTHYPLLAAEELHRRFGAVITGPPLATGWRSEKAGQEVLLGWAMVPPRDEAEGL